MSLIEIRAIVYGAILAVLLAAFGWYTIHERDVEHAKDVAAAERAVSKANAVVAAGTATAQTSETQNVLIWKKAVAIPAVGNVDDIVCQRAASDVSLSAAGSVSGAGTRNAAANRGSGPTFDPKPAILDRAHVADAQIAYLQRRIADLEKQMNSAP